MQGIRVDFQVLEGLVVNSVVNIVEVSGQMASFVLFHHQGHTELHHANIQQSLPCSGEVPGHA